MSRYDLYATKLPALLALAVATVLSVASVWEVGERTARIGGLVEDCCDCLAAEDCLQEGASAETCSSEYNPGEAMSDQLEIHVERTGCELTCPDCRELKEDYEVEFTTEPLRQN